MSNIVELHGPHGNEQSVTPSAAKSDGGIAAKRHGPASCPPPGTVNGVNPYLTPRELAQRWRWHVETIRLWLRLKKLESVIVGWRRLIPLVDVERVERSGLIHRAV
jgi:hypothetical protein